MMATRKRGDNDAPRWTPGKASPGLPVAVLRSADRTPRDLSTDSASTENRVAVVSGGDRGLGLALVRALAERGMRVVMATNSPSRGRAALDDLGELTDRVAVRHLDLSDQVSVSRLVGTLKRQLGRCDALINDAPLPIEDEEHVSGDDVVRRAIDTELLGTWQLAQAVAPLMCRNGHGRIVNVTSEVSNRAWLTAINALTHTLAEDLAGDGVLVNACCPGPSALAVADRGSTTEFAGLTDTAIWLAMLPDDGPTGGLFRDLRPIAW